MANGGEIRFGIGFDVDSSGLQKVQKELKAMRDMTPTNFLKMKGIEHTTENINKAKSELNKTLPVINEVEKAYKEAFNSDLGVVNIKKLGTSLNQIGLDKIYRSFSNLGETGTKAFRDITTQALKTNLQLKQSYTLLDKMGETIANTIKWNISSSMMNNFTGTIQEAYGYVKSLDSSLNDIRIVAGQSAEEMDRFAEKANKAAKALGTATVDYTDAALTFYQQGLSDQEVEARTNLTLKVSNVTGLDSDDAAEYVTSVLNGYKVGSEEAEAAMDKLAAVGAHTASSLAELSEGMAKTAAAANAMGVSEDQLAATLATVISTTRQDPSSIGTAFKTIYARISDIKTGSEDAEVSLGNYTKKMADMGFSVLDAEGNMRDLGEVMEEIGGKWSDLTREQQISLAQTMAGTRQYSNLIALFDNWAQYEYALGVSMESTGTLQEQQNVYLESTAAHLEQLRAAKEGVFDSAIDTKGINTGIDALTKLLELLEQFIDGIGGMRGVLLGLGAIVSKALVKPMSEGFVTIVNNIRAVKYNAEEVKASLDFTKALMQSQGAEDAVIQKVLEAKQVMDAFQSSMSEKDKLEAQALLDQVQLTAEIVEENKKKAETENQYFEALKKTKGLMTSAKTATGTGKLFDTDKNGNYKNTNKKDDILNVYREENNILEKQLGIIKSINITKKKGAKEDNAERQQQLGSSMNTFLQQQKSIIEEIVRQKGKIIDYDKLMETSTKMMNAEDGRYFESRKEQFIELIDLIKKFNEERKKGTVENFDAPEPDTLEEGANKNLNNFINNLKTKQIAQDIGNLTSSFTQLGFAISSFANIWNTINDPDLSAWEKTIQVTSALSMMIPSLATGITGVMSAGKGLLKNIISINFAMIEELEGIQATTLAEFEQATAKKVTEGAITAEKKAALDAAAANYVYRASLGPILIAVAALAIAIREVVVIYRELTKAQREAEQASKNADLMSQNLENVKTKAEDIKSAFDGYNQVKKSLEECTKSTDEWYSALNDVNEKVLDIIEKYPELSEYISRDANGALTIDEDAQAEISARLQEGVVNARYASIVANQQSKAANIRATNEVLANEQIKAGDIAAVAAKNIFLPFRPWIDFLQFITTRKWPKGSLGLAKDFTVDRKLSKDVGSQIGTQLEGKTLKEAKDIVRNLAEQNRTIFTTDNDIDKYVDEYTGSLQQISKANAEYAKEVEATSKAMVLETLGDEYGESTDAIAGALAKTMQSQTEALSNTIKEEYKSIKSTDEASSEKVADLWARYQKASGETRELKVQNAVRGSGDKQRFIMSDGEEVSLEAMSRVIASYEALEKVTENAEEVSVILEQSTKEISNGLKSFFLDDFKTLSTNDIEMLQSTLEEKTKELIHADYYGLEDLGTLREDVYKEYEWKAVAEEMQVSVEKAKELLGEDFFDNLKIGVQKAQQDLSNLKNDMFSFTREIFEGLNTKDLSINAQQQMIQTLDKAYLVAGEEGAEQLGKIYSSLKPEQVEKFNKVLNSVDWNNTSVEDLKDALKENGVTANFTTEQLEALVVVMEEVSSKSIPELAEKFKSLSAIISKVNEVGDTITEEEYNSLSGLAKSYFTMNMEGMYALTGAAEDFKLAASSFSVEDVKKEIQNNYDAIDALQRWDTVDKSDISVGKDYTGGHYSGVLFDQEKMNEQILYLRDLGQLTDEEFMRLQKNMESGEYQKVADAAETLSEKFKSLTDEEGNAVIQTQDYVDNIATLSQAMAMSAGSLAELDAMKNSGEITDGMQEIALDTVTRREAESYGLDYKEVIIQADAMKELAEGYKLTTEEARRLAIENQRMNKGFQDLKDNWKDWKKGLNSKDMYEFAKASKATTAAIADLVGASEDLELPKSFYDSADNMALIEKAANGSEEAINQLGLAVAKTSVEMMEFDLSDIKINTEGLSDAEIGSIFDSLSEGFETNKQIVLDGIQDLQDNLNGIEVGEDVTQYLGENWVTALNKMALDTSMSVEQMNSMLNSMGVQAEVATTTKRVKQNVPWYKTREKMTTDGQGNIIKESHIVEQGLEPVWGDIEVAQINTGSSIGQKPKVTYTGNGGAPSGGGKKGGGGGGGGSAKQPDKMDYVDKVEDRYHDINVILKETENEMNKLQKAQDKLYGPELINNLNKQLALLEQQKIALKEKLKLQKEEQRELKKSLGGQGVKFDEIGNISNYNEILAAKGNELNAMIDKYNKMSAEEQEAYKETVEKAKEDFKKFQDDLNRYDTLITEEIPGVEAEIQEAIDKQVEINIKKFDLKVDVRLELQEAKKKWNEFQTYVIDGFKKGDLLGELKNKIADFKTYFDKIGGIEILSFGGTQDNQTGKKVAKKSDRKTLARMGLLEAQENNLRKAMKELDIIGQGGTSKIFGKDKNAALEAVKKYQEQIMQSLTDIKEIMDSLDELQTQQLQKLQEAANMVYEAYDRAQQKIEDNIALLEKLQDNKAFTKSKKTWLSQQFEVNTEELASAQKKMKEAEDQMALYANDKESEMYKQALANYRENQDKVMELTAKGAALAADIYTATVDDAFNEIEKRMTDGKGFAYLDEEWELLEKDASMYLDTVNSTFNVQQLKSKYQKSIDETSNLNTQKKLNELMDEEIAKLEKKDRLTQYDIDRANARYELALKQIALEEAQQNKSQMRLRRDSQGNYSYQYVSDEKQLADAQDELNKAQNDLYNMDKNEVKNSQNEIYTMTKEMYQKLAEVEKDFSITQEEREMRSAQIKEKYSKLIMDRQKDFNVARLNLDESFYDSMSLMYQTDMDTFTAMTGLKAGEWNNLTASMLQNMKEELIPGYKDGITEMIDIFIGEGGFTEETRKALKICEDGWKDYKDRIQETCEASGINIEELAYGIDNLVKEELKNADSAEKVYQKEKKRTAQVQKLVAELKKEYAENQKLIKQGTQLTTKAQDVIEKEADMAAAAYDLEKAVKAIVSAINSASQAWTAYVNNTKNNQPSSPGGGGGGGYYGGGGGGTTPPPTTTYYTAVSKKGSIWTMVENSQTTRNVAENDARDARLAGKPNVSVESGTQKWRKNQTINRDKIAQFDGGGLANYTTGSGMADFNDGKLAILHQKELVLNKEDTKNMLEAVKILRSNGVGSIGEAAQSVITAMGQLQSSVDTRLLTIINYLQQGVENGNFANQLGGVRNYNSGRSSGIVQNITIEAEFPNADSVDTIKQAFEQIALIASQKANKK